ncbi:hypothetical protein H8M03_09445 [Sphingomonas sabuli]|uniref:Uncharacterized protein n=1 Tax=Sphingomonas sabuli TaxID=2764186 RepID=A0A7G9L0U3_9SPHN|nr:hypothetical protein [Sphingomonas sabuli]QNM82242.1 hypothetical protein H8M03_09445 [Sphingomonas sabuli]
MNRLHKRPADARQANGRDRHATESGKGSLSFRTKKNGRTSMYIGIGGLILLIILLVILF